MARPGVSTRNAFRRSGRALRRVAALEACVPTPEGTRLLLASLDDPSFTVRRAAAKMLAIQRDPMALEGLADVLRHGPDRARDRALRVLEWWAYPASEARAGTLAAIVRIGLSDARAWNRRRAARLLGVMGRAEDAGLLRACLADDDAGLRVVATEALTKLGDVDAWTDLLPLLEDPETRDVAARALGQLGERRAVPHLIDVWLPARDNPSVAEALGRLGDPGAIEPLAAGLALSRCADEVVLALLRLGDRRGWPWVRERFETARWLSPSIADALAEYATAEDLAWMFEAPRLALSNEWLPERTQRLLEAIGRRDLRALERGLRHPSRNVRAIVARVLGSFSREEAGEAGSAALRAALDDRDHSVVWWAVYALGRRADTAAVTELVAKIHDPNTPRGQVETFAELLGKLGDPSVVPALTRALPRFEGNPRFRLAEALTALAGEDAKATLIELLRDSDWRIRHKAIAALARSPDARSFRALRELAEADDPSDRGAALRELGAFAQPEAVDLLARALADPGDRSGRHHALLGLQRVADPRADDLIRAALDHEDPSTRDAAVSAAATRGLEPGAWLDALADRLARERYSTHTGWLEPILPRLDALDAWPAGFDPTRLREQTILLQQRIRAHGLSRDGGSNTDVAVRDLDRLRSCVRRLQRSA